MSTNPLNYATQPAAQRLHNAGIVLETEASWRVSGTRGFYLSLYPIALAGDIPAPQFMEVWRVLQRYLNLFRYRLESLVWDALQNETPTDALIDLLVWVKKQEEV